MHILNGAILKNPINWVTVVLMLVFAGFAGHLFLKLAGIEAAKP